MIFGNAHGFVLARLKGTLPSTICFVVRRGQGVFNDSLESFGGGLVGAVTIAGLRFYPRTSARSPAVPHKFIGELHESKLAYISA